MAGKGSGRLELEQVFLHYRDENGKKKVIKLRTSELDAVIFSREVADKVRGMFPSGGDDPEEPVDEAQVVSLAGGGQQLAAARGNAEEDTGNCYIVNGKLVCV